VNRVARGMPLIAVPSRSRRQAASTDAGNETCNTTSIEAERQ